MKEKYERRSRSEILEDEVRREMSEPKKSTTEKIKNVVKSIKPPERKVKQTVGGFPVSAPEKEKTALEALPDNLREEIRPVIAEAENDGHAISNYLKNSRIERYFEKRAIMRRIKREQAKDETSH